MDYIYFLVYKFFKFLMLILPKKVVKIFLDGIVFLVSRFNLTHKNIAMKNLDFIYGDKFSEQEKSLIIKESYKNLVYNIYEFIENQTLDLEGFKKKIDIKNESFITDAIKEKRKIILITAHFGNWELGSSFIPLKYGATTIVGRLLNNKYLNEDLLKARNNHNATMLSTNEAGKGLIRALKKGDILGLVIDQHNTAGIDVEFLGHTVKQTDSTSRLALKFDALIIPVFFKMEEFGKYTADFCEPIDPRDVEGENKIEYLTQKQADVMGDYIYQNPKQWFLQHKRFKYYNKDIYE